MYTILDYLLYITSKDDRHFQNKPICIQTVFLSLLKQILIILVNRRYLFQVYTTSGSSISASVNPELCVTDQTPTSNFTEYGKAVTFADIASSRYLFDIVRMK